MNVPNWVWLLAGIALILLILFLVGIRFDLNVS